MHKKQKNLHIFDDFMSKMTPKIDVIFHEPRPTNDTNRPKMPHKCHYNKGGIGRYIPGFGY